MKEITLTADNFTKEVLDSSLPVVVDFWASWCVPCTMMSAVIDELAEQFDGKIKVGKVNVDEEDTLAEQFNIDAIPAIYLFKDGKVAATSLGYKSKDALLKELGL
ncbi:MAG: thioredoxin [Firmicutes bacterium]|jgi:thioredoxin|nr:thioredoxin [Bacillota bacterium]